MTRLRTLGTRVADLFARRGRDARLAEEIETHLDLLTEERVRQGLPYDEARAAARRAFGGVQQTKEQYRDQRGLPVVDALWQDVRFGARLLVRDRSFTAMAVLALGLGIGVNTTQFAIVNAYCLRPLPIADADRVAYLTTRDVQDREHQFSYRDFEDVRAATTGFAGVAVFTGGPIAVGDEGRVPDRLNGAHVSADAFRLLAEQPILGRDFRADDDRPGAPAVVMLGHGVWSARYGGDPSIIGRTVRINGEPAIVVGVMPEGFTLPNRADVWQPIAALPGLRDRTRDIRGLNAFGRLAAGVTFEQAQSELDAVLTRLAREYPDTNSGLRADVGPLSDRYTADVTDPAWLAFMTVGLLVVAIACANVANLLLARSVGRAREISIRASLGATRRRVVRQLLVESGLLGALGGALGLGVSVVSLRLFTAAVPTAAVPYGGFSLDGRVFVVLAMVCLGTAIAAGLVPALQVSRTNVNEILKDGGRTATGGVRARRWTATFLAGELALTMVLLAGVASGVRAGVAVERIDRVIDMSRLVTMSVTLPAARYRTPDGRVAFYERLVERIGTIGGVDSVTLATAVPTGGGAVQELAIDGRRWDGEQAPPPVWMLAIDSRYFHTLGLPVVRGRRFVDADGTAGHLNAIVNQRFAELHFPDDDPLGRRIRLAPPGGGPGTDPPWFTVVGISPTVRQRPFGEPDPVVYLPYRASPPATVALIARSSSDPETLTAQLRDEARALDADLPLYRPMTLEQAVREAGWNGRIAQNLLSVIASIALMLSVVGLYGVTAHSVAQRAPEIGLRLALGARPRQIRWLVVRRALAHLSVGLVVGVGATLVWDRLFSDGDGFAHPLIVAPVAVLLVLVTIVASLWPAQRASRLDPITVLRNE